MAAILSADAAVATLVDELLRARSSEAAVPGLALVERALASGAMPPLHRHAEPEGVVVRTGSLMLHTEEEDVLLEAGDGYVVPAGVAHAFVAGDDGARVAMLALVASAAAYEDFLRAVAPPVRAWPSGEELASLHAVAAVAGTEVLAPPGTLPPV
jgi:quercetin dioxygenase-like cupin family protein